MSNLVATGTDAGAARSLPLGTVSNGRDDPVEFLFSALSWPICGPQLIDFLRHLLSHLRGKLLIVWEGLRSHRSRMVWDFMRQQRGRLWLEFLPAYAPELNPVEYLWAHWKRHELPNLCPDSYGELSYHARQAITTDEAPVDAGIRVLAASRIVFVVYM